MDLRNGWLLAPYETLEAFLQRKEVFERASFFKEKSLSVPLYDLYDQEACVFYSNESLLPWQGAVLWEYFTEAGERYPVIQLRETLSKGFLAGYKKEEVLAHELVHAARFAFKEPLFEEMFAYQTSTNSFRRFLGPLCIYPLESAFFVILSLAAPCVSLFLDSFWGIRLLLIAFSFFFLRLIALHSFFFLCKSKLEKIGVLPKLSLAVMLRLSDMEIIRIAISSMRKVRNYFEEQSKKEIRLQSIMVKYFKEK